MALDLVIRGAIVVRETGTEEASVGITEGRIAAIAPDIAEKARETIDAQGLHLFPGVLDAHVHFNDPGRDAWEGVATGSAALAAGGGTTFIDMPLNSSPPTLTAEAFDVKRAACEAAARTDFALWGGLTPLNLDSLEALAERGVAGFKAFMSGSGIEDFPRCDDETLFRGMRIAARLGLPVAVHAENDGVTAALAVAARAEGRTGVRDWLDTRPVTAEAEAIGRALALAEEAGCRLHVVHTSSARGVRLIRAAVADGLCDATCETCPHYLFFTDRDMVEIGARAKCAPPLRSDDERKALLAEVVAGHVDTIGSDHSPSPPGMKGSADFFSVWGGISGAQTTLRALLTLGVRPSLIAALTAGNPARRFHLPGKAGIVVGADADLALVDPGTMAPLRAEELHDRHRLSPYVGRALRGTVRRTLVRGRTVFLDGAVIGEPVGRFLRPTLA